MISVDPVKGPVICRLVRLTGTVRHWSCRCQHQVCVDQLMFPVCGSRFVAWASLQNGVNSLTVSVTCRHCRLDCSCDVTLEYRPSSSRHVLQPVLLLEDDHVAEEVQSLLDRISVGCALIQIMLSDKLLDRFPSCPRRALTVTPSVVVHRLSENCRGLAGDQLWSFITNELSVVLPLDLTRCRVLAFIPGRDVQLGSSGLALLGSPWLATWPGCLAELVGCLTSSQLFAGSQLTRGACFCLSLGAAAHELCHALDVGHATYGLMAAHYARIGKYLLPTVYSRKDGAGDVIHQRRRDKTRQIGSSSEFELDACAASILFHHRWFLEAPDSAELATAAPHRAELTAGPPRAELGGSMVQSDATLCVAVCLSAHPRRLMLFQHGGLLPGHLGRLDLCQWTRLNVNSIPAALRQSQVTVLLLDVRGRMAKVQFCLRKRQVVAAT